MLFAFMCKPVSVKTTLVVLILVRYASRNVAAYDLCEKHGQHSYLFMQRFHVGAGVLQALMQVCHVPYVSVCARMLHCSLFVPVEAFLFIGGYRM